MRRITINPSTFIQMMLAIEQLHRHEHAKINGPAITAMRQLRAMAVAWFTLLTEKLQPEESIPEHDALPGLPRSITEANALLTRIDTMISEILARREAIREGQRKDGTGAIITSTDVAAFSLMARATSHLPPLPAILLRETPKPAKPAKPRPGRFHHNSHAKTMAS